MNSIRITLCSLFIAGSALAAETVKFISLDACKSHYTKSVTAVAGQTADTYCADKIMSFVEACTATKITEYVTANKLKALTDLTNTEQTNLKTKFSYQCQIASQNDLAAQQKAAQAKAAAAAAASASSSSSSSKADSGQKMMQIAAGVTAAAPLLTGLAKTLDEKKAPAVETKPAASESSQKSAAGNDSRVVTNTETGVTDYVKDPQKSNPELYKNKPTSADNAAPAPIENATATTESAAASNGQSSQSYETLLKTSPEELAAAKKTLAAEADAVKKEVPGVAKEADKLNQTADSSGAPVKPSAISQTAKSATAEMQSKITEVTTSSTQLKAGGTCPPFSETSVIIEKYRAKAEKYYAQKETCTNAAETAQWLCVEGTSPGVQTAKVIMDASGPIIAVVSSAQQACSKTAKVTKLVSTGLTIAKGVCVGAKLYCDVTCGKSKVEITGLSTSFEASFDAAVKVDFQAAQEVCSFLHKNTSTQSEAIACDNELKSKIAAANGIRPKLSLALNTEAAVKPGTSPEIAVKCTSMMKDVVLLAVQAAGTLTAYNKAKSCEEKLSASGPAGATITTQQYCEKSENVSTQLCVCQKNPMAKDCPGAVITDSSAGSSNSSDIGANIKSVGGNSAFAGGFGSNPKPTYGNPNLGKDSINGAIAGKEATKSDGGPSGGFDGGGSRAGSSTLGNVPGSAEAVAAAKKEADEKKKWGFGAFQSESAMGSGGSGSSVSKYGKSGALTTGDQAAIQRQIASEKYAAEVSTASGKSNWEKVRSMYLIKENSFIFGQ